jgi:hypothetical protein
MRIFTAQIANFAFYPLNCLAGMREQGAELTLLAGSWLGSCR